MAKKKIKVEKVDVASIKASIKKQTDAAKKKMNRQRSAPRDHEAPDFWGWMDDPDIGNPFDTLEDTGSIEENDNQATEVMSDALRRIVEEKRRRREKYHMLTDANFYLVVCFQTHEQKEEFMQAKGWDRIQGNAMNRYLNGLEIADLEGIEIEPVYIPTKEPPQAPKALRDHPIIGEPAN